MKPRNKCFARSGWGIILAISALLLYELCTSAQADSSPDQQRRLEAYYDLGRPEGSGPFPAVMMVSGCEGFASPQFKDRYVRVARNLKDQGFVVVKVDYLAARGESRCWHVYQKDVVHDITRATMYLRAQPFVKTTAINVIGWSFGGGMALIALSEGDNRPAAPVNAVAAYCPYFDSSLFLSPWNVDVPVLILCGDQDTTAPPSRVQDLLSQLPVRDRVKFIVYPNAYHGFDNSDLPPKLLTPNGTRGYNEKAAKAAWEEVERFLRR